ncbi:MAG: alanine dehydrogenase, partial [Gammaproteobacteria bacterium]|nr:alanine dehydrogenase [Gammaproteobacteria bacterium]
MKIGVVKEIKDKENRIALTPSGTGLLVAEGHQVSVEENAGIGSGFSNEEYLSSGAEIVSTAEAWDGDLVIKIKEPLEQEYQFLKGNILFTYFHLAGVPAALTDALIKAGTSAIAYETVEDDQGRLPLLAPMSAVAGNVAANVGGYYLAKFNGGKGIQLGSVMGKRNGKVMVIGSGIVGQHAAH